MADETDTQVIEKNTAAYVAGFIKGFVTGIVVNWKEIAIAAGLIVGLVNYFKEKYDTQWVGQHLQEKQQQIDQLKTNIIETP